MIEYSQELSENPIEFSGRLNSDMMDVFINGRCEDVLKRYPDECVDFIFTSPPYADMRNYGISDSKISPDCYVDWFIPKAAEFHRVLKNTGSFVLNINDRVVNGRTQLYVYEIILRLCRELGFNLVRDYIWHNPATPPNIYSTGKYGRCKKSHEFVFWFSKGDTWTFNMDSIRKPYCKDMSRLLNGKRHGTRKENSHPSPHSADFSHPWADNGGADPGSVISIPNTLSNDTFSKLCRNRGISHPARFPEKLAEFFILAGTNAGDVVLDPFSGSGTTAVTAQRHGRHWIGIDANSDYCELSRERMAAINAVLEDAVNKKKSVKDLDVKSVDLFFFGGNAA